jgi:hypothetical protein
MALFDILKNTLLGQGTQAAESASPLDRLDEVTVRASPNVDYDLSRFTNQNFLKSAKFAVRFLTMPSFVVDNANDLRKLTYLCDSIEFPGQTISTTDFRIPGKLKVRAPYMRDINEVSFTFYHSADMPVYELFNTWIGSISPTTALNSYFDEIVGYISLFQFEDTSTSVVLPGRGAIQNMRVNLIDAYPLSIQSMPSNWMDDGFHKVNVSFFFRDIEIVPKNTKF